jgi:pimeloyl-ACP methyl ester carboxylesterase
LNEARKHCPLGRAYDRRVSNHDVIHPGRFFSNKVLPDNVTPWLIRAEAGDLTALRALPAGTPRGVALLVHGFTGSKEDFEFLLPELAARGWEAWAFTSRGHADSAQPGSYALADFAEDTVAVARAISGFGGREAAPVHLVGHSFGGVVVGEAVVAAPDAFVDVTFLCSGPHGWEGRKDDRLDAYNAYPNATYWDLEFATPASAEEALRDPHEAFRRERALGEDRAATVAIAHILEEHEDRGALIAATGLPVMVTHGDADDAWPVGWQRDWAARMCARYEVIVGAGHLPNLDQPARTAGLLSDFWGGAGRSTVEA